MDKTSLGTSPALGLWARHLEAMDSIYDHLVEADSGKGVTEELPEQLRSLWEEHEVHVRGLIASAEADRNRLFLKLRTEVEALISDKKNRLRADTVRVQDAWNLRWYLRAADKRIKLNNGPAELNVTLEEGPGKTLVLYMSIWAKGGRPTGSVLKKILRGGYIGADEPSEEWSRGSVVIAKIPLETSGTNGDVDLDALYLAASKALRAQIGAPLSGLFDFLRGPK